MNPQLLVAHLLRATLFVLYTPLKLLPTRRRVVMLSREHDEIPQDFALLREAILRADPTAEVVVLVRMLHPGLRAKVGYSLHMLQQLYQVARSRVLIVDTYSIIASVPRHRKSLTVIQIWHALGAFKKFGLSILGQEEGRDERLAKAMRMHRGYDLVLASGERARAPYAEALGTPLERVLVAPLPRVDALLRPAERERQREAFFARNPHLAGERIALYAPTFRMDGRHRIDPEELSEKLAAAGIRVVVKRHPLETDPLPEAVETDPGSSTQDLLHVAELFVTDYSSTIFEAAVLSLPSYFLAPDLDEYLASRDLYLDYARDLPGPTVRSIEELVEAIGRAEASPARSAEFARAWVDVPAADPAASDTPCANRIANLVVDALNGTVRERISACPPTT